jgi:hypothetical protein
VKFVAVRDGKRKVVDRGLSSAEGAVAGYFRSRDLVGADDGVFVARRSKGCPRIRGSFRDALEPEPEVAARDRFPSETEVGIVGAEGVDPDGAFSGILSVTPRAECFDGRRVRLVVNGRTLDAGTTTENGGWALHITSAEYARNTTFRVRVAKAETSTRQECTAGGASYEKPTPKRGRFAPF